MNLLGITLLLAWSTAEGYVVHGRQGLQCYNTLSRRCMATLHRSAASGGDEDLNELVVAARHGDVATMERVLTEDQGALNSRSSCSKPTQMDGATALIWASRMGFDQAVSLLLKKDGVDVDAATASGWTALYAAAMNGEEECVEALLLAGANIEAAMAMDDEFTNVKLLRMVEEAGIDRSPRIVAPSAPASAVDDDAESSADWRANAKPVAVQDPVVIQSLAGLDAAAELRLKLQWSAPPSDEEDSTAALERKTVFKLRTERLAELEKGGLASSTQAAPPAGASPSAPVASVAPSGGGGGAGAAPSIQALEAKIDRLLAQSKADYAEGFKDGFAAGQAAGGGGGGGPSSDGGGGSEFGGSLF